MSTFNSPVQISNIFKPKLWGRRDLEPLFDISETATAADGPLASPRIGEVWVTADASRFLNGPAAGMTLAEASEKYGPELNGKSWPGRRFPLLGKYIFTSDWLSVQVHPNDAYAATHEAGSRGKCEMWYFLKTDHDASILLGLKPGVTREQLLPAFKGGMARDILRCFRPEPEEAVFLAPGIVHALGPGLVCFEVEENSDITYRLDDYHRPDLDGKPRELHLEKGLEVIRPELTPSAICPGWNSRRNMARGVSFSPAATLPWRNCASTAPLPFKARPIRWKSFPSSKAKGAWKMRRAGWPIAAAKRGWFHPPQVITAWCRRWTQGF